jgi:hypothetical protein
MTASCEESEHNNADKKRAKEAKWAIKKEKEAISSKTKEQTETAATAAEAAALRSESRLEEVCDDEEEEPREDGT